MKLYSQILLYSFFICSCPSWAQNVGGNMQAGGTSGDVRAGNNLFNVDQYTGTGSANVLIYEYGIDNLGLGVSLSYSAKGNRVNDLASSVGLGWNLNAGGTIVREVRGIEDEITMPSRFYSHLGWQYSWGFVPGVCSVQSCFNYNDTLQGILVPDALTPGVDPDEGAYTRYKVYDDQEADLFHYSVGSRSFSFAFKKTTNGLVCHTFPKTEVKVEILNHDYVNGSYINERSGVPKSSGKDSIYNILTFRITDESGNKFYFKRGDYQIKEFKLDSLAFTPCRGVYYATQNWILEKVVTYSGKEILFTYVKKYMEYLENITEEYDTDPAKQLLANSTNDTILSNPLTITEQYWKGYKHHLSKIQFPGGGTVSFDLDHSTTSGRCDCSGDFRLKSITAERALNSTDKNSITYRLNQSYFNTPKFGLTTKDISYLTCSLIESTSLTSTNGFVGQASKERHKQRGLRLKLNGIQKIGTDGTTSETWYNFGYNQTPMPYRFGPGQDYYGYSNGDTAIPFYWVRFKPDSLGYIDSPYYLTIPLDPYVRTWGADRSYSFVNAQAFVLNKITNRFGGKDSIIYVDYTLANPTCSYGNVSESGIGCSIDGPVEGDLENDGLVVGKVISSDKYSVDLKTVTEYTYAGGERFFRGGYTRYPSAGGTVYTNFFLDPRGSVNGSNHGFDTVTVCTYGYNNERLSKTKTVFSNLMYQGVSSIYKPTGDQYQSLQPTMRKYRMGAPLKSESFDELDNIIVSTESVFEERSLGDSIINFSTYYVAPAPPNAANPPHCWIDNGHYEYLLLDHQWLRLAEYTVKRYSKGPGVSTPKMMTTTYIYGYDENENPVITKWWDSKGDTFKKYRYYADDYLVDFPTNPTLGLMQQKNMQFLLSSEVWKMRTNDSVLLKYEIISPGFDSSNNRLRFPASFTTNLKEPLSSTYAHSSSYIDKGAAIDFLNNTTFGSKLEKSWQATKYDDNNNIIERQINDKDMFESLIVDSKTFQLLAEVKNARHDDVVYSSFDCDYSSTGWQDGNIWFDPDNIVVSPIGICMGRYVYEFNQPGNGSINYLLSRPLKNKAYILSFWSYAPTSSYVLQAELHHGSSNLGTITTTVINQVGSWKLHTATVNSGTGDQIKLRVYSGVSGSNSVYVDEVRIYPVEATMKTMAYKPFFGVGSTCSENNYIEYLEYDVFGKVNIMRDMRGNIKSKIESAEDNNDAYNATPYSNTSTY